MDGEEGETRMFPEFVYVLLIADLEEEMKKGGWGGVILDGKKIFLAYVCRWFCWRRRRER